jgi:hypothetical protein
MSESHEPIAPDKRASWGHLIWLIGLAVFCLWYVFDVLARSRHVESTLLIRIIVPVLLVFLAVELIGEVRRLRRAPPPLPNFRAPTTVQIGALIGLFVIYVVTLPWAGLDMGSFVYIVASLAVQRIWTPVSWGIAAILSAVIAYSLKAILPYDVPLLLF